MVFDPTTWGQAPGQQGQFQVDPRTGFNPNDQRTAAMGQMGQLGMLLMAAGQRMNGAQRGQILAQGAGLAGDTSASMHRLAQARSMTDSYQNAQVERSRLDAALQGVLSDPNIPPQEKAYAMANPAAYLANRYNVQNRAPSEFDQRIASLRKLGMDDNEIRQVVSQNGGRYRYFAGGVVDTQNPSVITPYKVAGQEGAVSASTGTAEDPAEGVPENPVNVFGVEGAWGKLMRKGRGVVGSETPADAQRARESAWLGAFKNTADDVLAETFDGRKTNYTIKRASVVAKPEEFWSSAQEARGHTELIANKADEQLTEIDRLLQDPRIAGNKTAYAKMQIKRGQLIDLKRKADTLLTRVPAQPEQQGGNNDPHAAARRAAQEALSPRR